MVKPVLFCTVKETNTDHPISDSQMESQFRRSIALRSNLSKSVFFVCFFFKENALLGLVCDDVVTDRCSLLLTSVEPLSSAMCENAGILSKNGWSLEYCLRPIIIFCFFSVLCIKQPGMVVVHQPAGTQSSLMYTSQQYPSGQYPAQNYPPQYPAAGHYPPPQYPAATGPVDSGAIPPKA